MKEMVMFVYYPYLYFIRDEDGKIIWDSFSPFTDGNHYKMIDIHSHIPTPMSQQNILFIFED